MYYEDKVNSPCLRNMHIVFNKFVQKRTTPLFPYLHHIFLKIHNVDQLIEFRFIVHTMFTRNLLQNRPQEHGLRDRGGCHT